jgi:small-conductance mechanosensitive channel
MFGDFSLETIERALSIVGDNPYLQALVVIGFSLIAAKLVDVVVTRVFFRLASRTHSDLDDQLIEVLHRPIFYTVLLIGLWIVLVLLVEDLEMRNLGTRIIQTIVVFHWALFGIRAARIILAWMTKGDRQIGMVQATTRPLFEIAAKLIIFALAVYFVLISWGINPVGWLASAGIVAVAVGLAAQDALGNLFAGISILADTPYKLGDYIVLDGKERGRVTKIGIRSTRILTRDDIEIIVPNSAIASSKIVNESGGPSIRQRMRIPVGVAYGSDPDQVKEILLGVVKGHKDVSKFPEPWVRFSAFGDSSLDFEIRCWINEPEKRGRVLDAVNSGVYKALGEAGVEIPFPKRDLYIKEIPDSLRAP